MKIHFSRQEWWCGTRCSSTPLAIGFKRRQSIWLDVCCVAPAVSPSSEARPLWTTMWWPDTPPSPARPDITSSTIRVSHAVIMNTRDEYFTHRYTWVHLGSWISRLMKIMSLDDFFFFFRRNEKLHCALYWPTEIATIFPSFQQQNLCCLLLELTNGQQKQPVVERSVHSVRPHSEEG